MSESLWKTTFAGSQIASGSGRMQVIWVRSLESWTPEKQRPAGGRLPLRALIADETAASSRPWPNDRTARPQTAFIPTLNSLHQSRSHRGNVPAIVEIGGGSQISSKPL